jgi:hypothetical protein
MIRWNENASRRLVDNDGWLTTTVSGQFRQPSLVGYLFMISIYMQQSPSSIKININVVATAIVACGISHMQSTHREWNQTGTAALYRMTFIAN